MDTALTALAVALPLVELLGILAAIKNPGWKRFRSPLRVYG